MTDKIALQLNPATQSGLTVQVNMYTGSALADTISMTEAPAESGRYIAVMPALAAGHYDASFVADGQQVGTGRGYWTGEAWAVERVTLVDTTTVNADMRGTDNAYVGTPPTAAAIAGAILAVPANKLATDEQGRVTAAGLEGGGVHGISDEKQRAVTFAFIAGRREVSQQGSNRRVIFFNAADEPEFALVYNPFGEVVSVDLSPE